ncbi:MAG: hypothetical protein IM516_01305 [Pseudanabaena sp. M158S2SP1A06QC]|nr:hypothetical protein [Pseudanabaena sp. M158S2SP1A06QC]MCA6624352.1 hypothetical protein [Pseudanabaena sp. M165S2SP1A06QC]
MAAKNKLAVVQELPQSTEPLETQTASLNATENLTLEQIVADELLDSIDWKAVNGADIPLNQPQLSANQQSAQVADILAVSQSAHADKLSANQQLSAPLSAIIEYAKKKDEWISARQVQAGIAIFKTAKADEIRNYFQWLADKNLGVVRGYAENLEFSVN